MISTQETQQKQNMSRWELVEYALNKDFTSLSDLKARFASVLSTVCMLVLLRDKTTRWRHWPKIQNPYNLITLHKSTRFLTFRFILRY